MSEDIKQMPVNITLRSDRTYLTLATHPKQVATTTSFYLNSSFLMPGDWVQISSNHKDMECVSHPMSGNPDSGSYEIFYRGILNGKILLMESGILGFGIQNTPQGFQNPTKVGSQNSSSTGKDWNQVTEIRNPESKTV